MPRINRIRIKEVDHTLSSKGGRVLEVTAGSHSFNTPTRPFTVAEITAKITPSQQFVKKLASMPPIDSLEEIDQFKIHRHDASASIKSTTWTKMEHPPECHCSMCRGDDREKLFDRFGYLDDGSITKSGMRHFSILHDHQSDIDELEIFRRYTASGGTAEYDERVESNLSELRKLTRVRDRLRYRVPTTSSNRPWR